MKRKELLKKALIYSIIGATVAGNVVPAYAYTNSVLDVETGTVTAPLDAESYEVYATLASSFKVTIPKKITLDGGTKKGSYTVDVEGDIGGTDVIKVVPDPSVALHSTNLTDVTASISQDKTEWSYNQILADSKVAGNGLIDASGITAGAWNGTFNFNVGYESAGSETPITLEAGLYDANGVMLCSWEESGIDVETNYSGTSSDTNYYKTSTASPYYVLTNTYQTATKVVIPDSVTSIGERAFYSCTSLNSITIPDSVTSIGNYAFTYCSNLTNVTIGNSVTSIGDYAFSNCRSLTSITIPEGVTSIGERTFYYCTSLTSIEIPESVTSIGDYAFSCCTSLNEVTIPSNVTSIGQASFYYCASLTNITIPESVTSIGANAFSRCTDLPSINVVEDNVNYCSADGVLFNKDMTTLVCYPAGKAETSYTIPNSVTSIEDYAFYFGKGLTNITISDSVTSIGEGTFSGCTDLTSINVVEDNAKYCSADGILFNKDMTTLVCYPAGKTETSYTIPNSVTSIGNRAFEECTKLTNIVIPESATSIGNYAFKGCTNIDSITIPDSVTSIGESAFYVCTSLNEVTFKTTSGWYVGSSVGAKTTAISSSNLANTSTAATYLKTTYYNKYWTR